ncbi:MAG: hypothetical protein RL701_362, partial [Pseudomonadota bacterium]
MQLLPQALQWSSLCKSTHLPPQHAGRTPTLHFMSQPPQLLISVPLVSMHWPAQQLCVPEHAPPQASAPP